MRIELQRALDEVLPPVPWLEAAVAQDLRQRRSSKTVDRSQGTPQGPTALLRPVMQLAAAALVVVLAAVAVAAFIATRYHGPQTAPADTVSVEAYQRMVSRDDGLLNIARSDSCSSLRSTCPASGHPLQVAMRRWMDDLNRSEPPARFAVIDAQLRRHLAANISDVNAIVAAYQAQDENRLNLANQASLEQEHWLDDVASSIASSQPGTTAAYVSSVRNASQAFGGCAACQPVVGQVDCAAMQSTSCEYDLIYAIGSIKAFQIALVHVTAPSSLAAQDAGLQRDLAQVDTGVLAMATAQATGDQAGFNAGRVFLEQAMPALNADVGVLGA